MTNPFQSPTPADSREPDETPVQRLHRFRIERRRWSVRCWVVGAVLIGFSLVYVSFDDVWDVEGMRGVKSIAGVTAMMTFFIGIIVVLLGPISWFWFFRK